MRDEKDAWNSFVKSGSVMDYLQYKSAQHAADGQKEAKDELDRLVSMGVNRAELVELYKHVRKK